MLIETYRGHAAYNAWMNAKLLDIGAELSEDERTRDMGAFFRSVHGTLNHVLLADGFWMGRLTGDPKTFVPRDADGAPITVRGLDQVLYPDFELFCQRRREMDAHIRAFVAGLDEAWLAENMRYRNSQGVERSHPRWWAVSHMFNHQTHHRGQVTTLLKQLGHDPGVTDLLIMLAEEHG